MRGLWLELPAREVRMLFKLENRPNDLSPQTQSVTRMGRVVPLGFSPPLSGLL